MVNRYAGFFLLPRIAAFSAYANISLTVVHPKLARDFIYDDIKFFY